MLQGVQFNPRALGSLSNSQAQDFAGNGSFGIFSGGVEGKFLNAECLLNSMSKLIVTV